MVHKINVYYWKDMQRMLDQYENIYPTKQTFKKDYKKLPVEFSFKPKISIRDNLNIVFDRLNQDNPLGSKKNQKWIGENLKPYPHTSMSVGDIVKMKGSYYLCKSFGWKKLRWR